MREDTHVRFGDLGQLGEPNHRTGVALPVVFVRGGPTPAVLVWFVPELHPGQQICRACRGAHTRNVAPSATGIAPIGVSAVTCSCEAGIHPPAVGEFGSVGARPGHRPPPMQPPAHQAENKPPQNHHGRWRRSTATRCRGSARLRNPNSDGKSRNAARFWIRDGGVSWTGSGIACTQSTPCSRARRIGDSRRPS
jgi:hypothetical protein